VALDEHLRRALERGGEPADPTGVYEDLIRRRERRRLNRRVKVGSLSLVVLAGCVFGVVLLSRVFTTSEARVGAGGGEGILFHDLVDGRSAVFVVQPDGSGLTRLTDGQEAGSASWSRDGTRIVFSRFVLATGTADLFLMSPDGSDVTRLTDTPPLSESRARWSPDGTRIAFEGSPESGPAGVYVMDANGNGVQRLTDPSRAAGSPDWSPDGSQLVFHLDAPVTSETGEVEIWIMEADGSNAHLVTDGGEVSSNHSPRWSPDGDRIVFTHDRDVYVVNVDGTGLTNLTPESGTDFYDRDPAWSSDGRGIVFESTRTHGDAQSLFTMNADGGDVRPLLDQAIGFCCARPDWRGDPTSVAPSVEPEPTATEALPTGEDIGLGFPVCNVTSVSGVFAPGVDGTAWVATKTGDVGCPSLGDGMQVVALDMSGDGVADTSFGPLQCDPWCSAFAAPDVDGDGTDELLIQNIQFTIAGLRLYDVRSDPQATVAPVTVASPGYPGEDLAPGAEPQFWIGGDAFDSDTMRCFEDQPPPTGPGRVLIQTSATQVPPDSPDSKWHATETWFDLRPDGTVTIVDHFDFEEPVASPSFAQRNPLCGARLPAPFGG